jgi:hypothetical protein
MDQGMAEGEKVKRINGEKRLAPKLSDFLNHREHGE